MYVRYYREPNGDYLMVWGRPFDSEGNREGRATAIGGLVTSVCTTALGPAFLRSCTPVLKGDVPAEWLEAIG